MRAQRRTGARPGLIVIVVVLWLLIGMIVLTGTLIAAFSQQHPARFAAPLKIYPVTQEIPGQPCPAGIRGVVGQGSAGPVCYQLTTGITIKRVNDIHVERAMAGGYAVSISLLPADSRALKRLTQGSAGQSFALTVRDQVIATPRVDAPITKGRVLITGNLSRSAAEAIVARLKGKAVPTPPPATNPAPSPAPSSAPAPVNPGNPAASANATSSGSPTTSPTGSPTTTTPGGGLFPQR